MKEKLINELNEFKTKFEAIDARFEIIWESTQEHKKHKEALTAIDIILSDLINRIQRFYTKGFHYRDKLDTLSQSLHAYNFYYGEIHMQIGLSMDEIKRRIIGIIDGIIGELNNYGEPSKDDPKFDKK